MTELIKLELDLSDDQLEIIKIIQEQYGLKSIEETAQKLLDKQMQDVRNYISGDVARPSWL